MSGEKAEGWGPQRRAAPMWSFYQFGPQSVGHLLAYASKRAAAGCFLHTRWDLQVLVSYLWLILGCPPWVLYHLRRTLYKL